MTQFVERLSNFVGMHRSRFSGNADNLFAFAFSKITRYAQFLVIIFERHETISKRFVENTRALLTDSISTKSGVMDESQLELFEESRRISTELHLEIESFYLFAKMMLDRIAHSLEFYFGQVPKTPLDSHDDLVKNLERYAQAKGLLIPQELSDVAHQLKKDISDHRDYQIAHEKSPRTFFATLCDAEGRAKIASTKLYPKNTDKQVETRFLNEMVEQLNKYLDLIISFVESNSDRTVLGLDEREGRVSRPL